MTSKLNRHVGSVFSDPSGRRRRRVRRIGYAAAGGCVTYMGLVALSLTGGPISPETLLPPGVPDKVEGLLKPDSTQAQRDGATTLADGSPRQPAAQPDGGDWVNRGTTLNPPGSGATSLPGVTPTPDGEAPIATDPPIPAPTESPVEPPATVEPPPPSEPPTLPSSPVDPTTLEPPILVDPSPLPTSPELDPTDGTPASTAPGSGDLDGMSPTLSGSAGD
jgi:hypothetical protein